MSDEYRAEIERFISRSMEHLRRGRKDGISILVKTKNRETGEKYKTRIIIEKFEDEEEDEH